MTTDETDPPAAAPAADPREAFRAARRAYLAASNRLGDVQREIKAAKAAVKPAEQRLAHADAVACGDAAPNLIGDDGRLSPDPDADLEAAKAALADARRQVAALEEEKAEAEEAVDEARAARDAARDDYLAARKADRSAAPEWGRRPVADLGLPPEVAGKLAPGLATLWDCHRRAEAGLWLGLDEAAGEAFRGCWNRLMLSEKALPALPVLAERAGTADPTAAELSSLGLTPADVLGRCCRDAVRAQKADQLRARGLADAVPAVVVSPVRVPGRGLYVVVLAREGVYDGVWEWNLQQLWGEGVLDRKYKDRRSEEYRGDLVLGAKVLVAAGGKFKQYRVGGSETIIPVRHTRPVGEVPPPKKTIAKNKAGKDQEAA